MESPEGSLFLRVSGQLEHHRRVPHLFPLQRGINNNPPYYRIQPELSGVMINWEVLYFFPPIYQVQSFQPLKINVLSAKNRHKQKCFEK